MYDAGAYVLMQKGASDEMLIMNMHTCKVDEHDSL
jgi:hypothetical protein